MPFEDKVSGKTYSFFEWVYRLIVINLITLLLCLLVIPLLPAIVSATSTIKDTINGNESDVLKLYFHNFKKHMEKSVLVWLILLLVIIIGSFSAWFYISWMGVENLFSQLGFWVMIFILITITLLMVHLPLVIVTFPKLTISEIYRTTMFITFRYLFSTLILFGTFLLMIIILPFIPISSLIGISVPLYLGIKGTKPVYQYLEKIDFKKIMHQVDEEN